MNILYVFCNSLLGTYKIVDANLFQDIRFVKNSKGHTVRTQKISINGLVDDAFYNKLKNEQIAKFLPKI